MRLSFLQSALALFGALTLVAGAPAARLEGVRPLSGTHPENWWKENQGRHEATSATWHAHEKRGPGKEVLDKLKAARAEADKGEPTGTNVEIPKAPVKPASAGGGSMPPGKGYKKRGEGEGPRRAAKAAREEDDDGPQPAGDMPPGKQWRRHISDVESGDADGDDGSD
ncbi:hypothetical protein FRC04_011313 [Tulasnella sp. 424]|nr:hypothetical protein FRC04_011313 [Tulasnella sp. 424]KAG8975515.1 hypothetical protein FRC05_005584 [Tulasnella sp. 425]